MQLFSIIGEQVKEFLPLTAIPEKKDNYIELKRYTNVKSTFLSESFIYLFPTIEFAN